MKLSDIQKELKKEFPRIDFEKKLNRWGDETLYHKGKERHHEVMIVETEDKSYWKSGKYISYRTNQINGHGGTSVPNKGADKLIEAITKHGFSEDYIISEEEQVSLF